MPKVSMSKVPLAFRFGKTSWHKTVSRNLSLFHQFAASRGHFLHSKDFGVGVRQIQFAITIGGTSTVIYVNPGNYQRYAASIRRLVATPVKVARLARLYKRYARALLHASKKLQKSHAPRVWEEFVFCYERMSAGLHITATIGREVADDLRARLIAKGISSEAVAETMGTVTYPARHTPLFSSQLDLLAVAAAKQGGGLSAAGEQAALARWLSTYQHIPVNFCDEPWTIADAKQQLKLLMRQDCAHALNVYRSEHALRLRRQRLLLRQLRDRRVSALAHAVSEGTYLNEFRKNVFSRVSLEYRSFFAWVVRQAGGESWRDCFYLTPQEIGRAASGEDIGIAAKVRERAVVAYYTTARGTSRFVAPQELAHVLHIRGHGTLQRKLQRGAHRQISGYSANGGKATGIAKIVLSSKDFDKFKSGDVLVASMTSVDYVPIMERACAFVTDEGGITSHASIVAREMSKPCVIGTKIATQALKDGDLVEVDADKGVVTVIKNNPVS